MTETSSDKKPVTFISCWIGAAISGTIAVALYFLTTSISTSFATHPIHSDNITAINISIAVRTLVTGMATLATGIFGFSTLGLFALGVQLLWKKVFASDTAMPENEPR
ncbi:MAG: DUF3082 domain-containing protein [Jaaginema sp. PMC 1079.18]|nr:DUF3082 domain-containing protein [Jaaginema sp. PMC 1080.18]MEC4850093.1 DUF3082 domain-containing protein [Jaaginema sp. PMC 1079.18]MEC4864819.1 DUF3082 domain-containing protein [Jaaginema sp. PMC 1078.18]